MTKIEHDGGDDYHEVKPFEYKRPMELFASNEMVKICAPMVRYTKYALSLRYSFFFQLYWIAFMLYAFC